MISDAFCSSQHILVQAFYSMTGTQQMSIPVQFICMHPIIRINNVILGDKVPTTHVELPGAGIKDLHINGGTANKLISTIILSAFGCT